MRIQPEFSKNLTGDRIMSGHCTYNKRTVPMLDEVISAIEKPALNPGQTYAQGAETCLRFRAHLCPGGRNMSQIQGTFMHGVHCLPPDSSLIFKESA